MESVIISDDQPNSDSHRMLMQSMLSELRMRSQELVKQIEMLTQSLGEPKSNGHESPAGVDQGRQSRATQTLDEQ